MPPFKACPSVSTSKDGDNVTMTWINRYASLGTAFSAEVLPTPVPDPTWVIRNPELSQAQGFPDDWLNGDEGLSVFSGNALWDGMQSRATVYSGHQFGQWAGQLGDGRALCLGEFQATPATKGSFELQLKGAGKTPFSRMGDGRAVLRSSIREFLCSEAMAGLGIPTTRALCLTTTPSKVIREEVETGAIVTRTAPSFIRFGHFEHFANQVSPEGARNLKQLADFTIAHYFQQEGAFSVDETVDLTMGLSGNPYAQLLHSVTLKTAKLMAQWQAVGFCHGVMNTDNMSILGLTLDFGPFQFMDGFNPEHICNHSDYQGRYAYGRQPQVAYWNLFCLAQALMPLIEDQELAMKALESYKTVFSEHWGQCFLSKLGLNRRSSAQHVLEDQSLINDTLQLLATEQVDFTLFWRRLSHAAGVSEQSNSAWQSVSDLFIDQAAWRTWQDKYMNRLEQEKTVNFNERMLQVNPKYVLRNHLAEAAIQKSKLGDHSEVERLFNLLKTPFEEQPEFDHYAHLPPAWASSIEISCSS